MKFPIYLSFILLICSNCKSSHIKSSIKGITLIKKNQVFYNDSTIEFNNKLHIYYLKDLMMFEYAYTFDSVNNGKLILTERRNAFFVFHKDSAFGYHYDDVANKTILNNERLPVDSVYKKHHNPHYDLISDWKVDEMTFDSTKKVLNEIYYYPTKKKDSVYFTYALYYAKDFLDVPVSFSKKLDRSRNSKLFKVVVTNNEDSQLLKKFNQPKILVVEQMERNTTVDNRVAFYFREYENTIHNKHH